MHFNFIFLFYFIFDLLIFLARQIKIKYTLLGGVLIANRRATIVKCANCKKTCATYKNGFAIFKTSSIMSLVPISVEGKGVDRVITCVLVKPKNLMLESIAMDEDDDIDVTENVVTTESVDVIENIDVADHIVVAENIVEDKLPSETSSSYDEELDNWLTNCFNKKIVTTENDTEVSKSNENILIESASSQSVMHENPLETSSMPTEMVTNEILEDNFFIFPDFSCLSP